MEKDNATTTNIKPFNPGPNPAESEISALYFDIHNVKKNMRHNSLRRGDLAQQGDGGAVVRVWLHGGQPQVGAEQRRARVLRLLLDCHAPAPALAAAVGHCVAVIFVKLETNKAAKWCCLCYKLFKTFSN